MNTLKTVLSIMVMVALLASNPSTFAADKNDKHNQNQNQQNPERVSAQSPNRSQPRVVRHPVIGSQTRTIPQNNQPIRVDRDSYHYTDGTFYRPQPSGTYVVVRPPIGVHVSYLPLGYISFYIGPIRYFYINYTYYRWDPVRTVYIVVEKPVGANTAIIEANENIASEIFAYPNSGQSQAQQDRDRYECYLWAVEQTGFDPATLDPASDKANDYRRAVTACLVARDYTVR